MAEEQIPKVINVHHFGGVDKLPSNAIYVGRGNGSKYGNPFSSKSGLYTKEECIALHRISLYQSLVKDPASLISLRQDLGGRDLACWCSHQKKVVGCHGDNYLHVLSPSKTDRTYDRTVVFYLMDDLRQALKSFPDWVMKTITDKSFLSLYLYFTEPGLEIEHVLIKCREWKSSVEAVEFLLAQLVIDLELTKRDSDHEMIKYRLDHACWVTERFITGNTDRNREPTPPVPLTKHKQKKPRDGK